MHTPRPDHHRRHRLQRDPLAIRLQIAFPLQHNVDLRHHIVLVRPAVRRNVRQVHRRQRVPILLKRPPCLTARAGGRRDFIKLGNGEAGGRGGHKGYVESDGR